MTAVRRALLLSTADRYFTFASNFAVAAAVSRILTPAEIGVSVVGMAILGIALSVREFASSNFIIQREVLTREDIRASSTIMLILTAIIVVVLLLATPALARAYGEERLGAYFHVICVCLFLDLIAIQIVALLRREMAYGRIVAIDLAGAAVGALTTIVLALSGFSYMSFAWAWLATSVVAGIISFALHPQPWIFKPSFSHWHSVVRFGGYNGGIALLYKVYDTVPYMLFGWILSPQAAAVFSRSLMICQLPNKIVLGGAMSVILPAFSEQAREGRSLKEPYLHALEIITALYWPAFLVLAVMAEPVVQIVLGGQWREVAPLVRVIAIASLFSFSFEVNYPVMVAILVGGLHAAAWSMLFIIPFQAVVSISFVKHHLGISHADIIRALWKSAAAALASAAGPLCIALAAGADWRLSFGHAVVGGAAALAGWLIGLKATGHPLLEEVAHVTSALRASWPFRTAMTPVLEK